MKDVKVKICGLSRTEDIDYANTLIPDYIGFVFAPKSKRYVSMETALKLKSRLNKGIKTVGVFVNEEPDRIVDLVNKGILDVVQLHGTENDAYVSLLKSRITVPVIQAFQITTMSDVRKACNSPADYILLDHGAGGTGKSFDWKLVEEIDRPYFLAGGLSAENVGDAIVQCKPYAVDVSSNVETDGVKDYEKMRAFVQKVREAV